MTNEELRNLKRSVYDRITEARKNGVSIGKMVNVGDPFISYDTVFAMMHAQVLPNEVWIQMDRTLKKLGW